MANDSFPWKCTTCGRPTTITNPNFHAGRMDCFAPNTDDEQGILVRTWLVECPNPECKAQYFRVDAFHGVIRRPTHNPDFIGSENLKPLGIGSFTFLPTTAQPLSEHVPDTVLADYNEAYLIRALSPKASATLARRALQGMIRHYWGVVRSTLHAELLAIEERCDPELYAAMMAVKSIGNIGAHPEQDVSLIVDIEPGEADALLDLIHLLDQEWYVSRAQREARIAKVKALSADKKELRGK